MFGKLDETKPRSIVRLTQWEAHQIKLLATARVIQYERARKTAPKNGEIQEEHRLWQQFLAKINEVHP